MDFSVKIYERYLLKMHILHHILAYSHSLYYFLKLRFTREREERTEKRKKNPEDNESC